MLGNGKRAMVVDDTRITFFDAAGSGAWRASSSCSRTAAGSPEAPQGKYLVDFRKHLLVHLCPAERPRHHVIARAGNTIGSEGQWAASRALTRSRLAAVSRRARGWIEGVATW